MHEGIAVGGPLDGLTYTVRSDRFLVVDYPARLAWVYRLAEDGTFTVDVDDDADPVTGTRPLDEQREVTAWSEKGYDIIAAPDAGDDIELDEDAERSDD